MARVVLEELTCKYGKTIAVNAINLEIGEGEFCVLLGPSGCGKTSTLRMIAGLVKPSSGQVYIDGEPVNDVYPGKRNVAMVFQNYALYPNRTVREHIALPLHKQQLSKTEIVRRIEGMAELLQITELLDRLPDDLSGGERQRVAIGRALVRQPRLFLLDEPLANLDSSLKLDVRANLKQLQEDLHVTTIYVTHDQVEAQGLADRIAVMNAGEIQQVGTPEVVYSRPANLFVAGFIGTPPMNILDGFLTRQDGAIRLEREGLTTTLREEQSSYEGPVLLGFRPEHCALTAGDVGRGLQGHVVSVEPQGSEYLVGVDVSGRKFNARVKKRDLSFRLEWGQEVSLLPDPQKIHLFDPTTTQRIL